MSVICASDIMNKLISVGLTWSPESGDPYPMRQVPCAEVAKVVTSLLSESGIVVNQDIEDWESISSFRPNDK